MKTNLFKSFCALFLLLAIVSGCKKSSDDQPKAKYLAPSMVADYKVVEIPSKLLESTDPYASVAVGYMSLANAFAGYTAYFNVPDNAVQSRTKSSGTIYTWSYGGTTVKLTYNEDATNRYWVWYINEARFMDCQESIMGKTGSFNIYDYENGGAAVIVYNWSQTATLVNATMKIIDGADSFFFKISASLDNKSGQFDLYEGTSEAGSHIINVTWLANGSGTWWVNYDGTVYSGSWTADAN
jgi:hypothetical protein